MAKAKKVTSAQVENINDLDQPDQEPVDAALEEGRIFDYITGNPVKDTDKERVRQRIARAIIHEYGIAAEDMEPDYKIVVGKENSQKRIGSGRLC